MNSRFSLASLKILRPECLLCFAGSSHSVNNGPVSEWRCRQCAVGQTIQSLTHSSHCVILLFYIPEAKSYLSLAGRLGVSIRLSVCRDVPRPPVAGLVSQHVFCLSFCWLSINPPSVHLGGGHPVDWEGLRCQRVDAVFQHQETHTETHRYTPKTEQTQKITLTESVPLWRHCVWMNLANWPANLALIFFFFIV